MLISSAYAQGLGDMFVVRTAGHVIDSAVLGSVEYAVTILNVPLVVVLGHDSCGAVNAALAAINEGNMPGGYVRDVVERVAPSILMGRRDGLTLRCRLNATAIRVKHSARVSCGCVWRSKPPTSAFGIGIF